MSKLSDSEIIELYRELLNRHFKMEGGDESMLIIGPKKTEEEEKRIKKAVIKKMDDAMKKNYTEALTAPKEEGGAVYGSLEGGNELYNDIGIGSGYRMNALAYYQSELKKHRAKPEYKNMPYRELQKLVSKKIKGEK
jgi:hypothetical protein